MERIIKMIPGRAGRASEAADHHEHHESHLSGVVSARRICTSEDCPMAMMLEAMPNLCELEPPKSEQPEPSAADQKVLDEFAEVKPYSDKVWGPASWTALEADILSLPEKLDAHEFCLFKIYLALRARYLSCTACAMHFEKAIKKMPNDAVHRTRAGLLRWLCGVHNDVNRRKQREPLSEAAILAELNAKAAVLADHEKAGGSGGSRQVCAKACPCTASAPSSATAPSPSSSPFSAALPAVAIVLLAVLVVAGLAALASAGRWRSWFASR
jgi:hypothetical protein